MSYTADGKLQCDMHEACSAPITHIDVKGFVYCGEGAVTRKQYQRCRKLTPAELKTLLRGEPIASYYRLTGKEPREVAA